MDMASWKCVFGLGVYLAFATLNASASLVALYTFDDAANLAADTSGGGHNGTIQLGGDGDQANDANFLAGGALGIGALRLSGASNDWISLPNDAALMPTNELSVAFWVRTGVQAGFVSVVRHDGHFTALQQLGVYATSTWSGGSLDSNAWPAGSHATLINGAWHHVATVFKFNPIGGTTTLTDYLDGQPIALNTFSGSLSGALATTSTVWALGATEGATEQWTGDLDDLRIYNHALTQAEVQAIPEPSMLAMVGIALVSIVSKRRRK